MCPPLGSSGGSAGGDFNGDGVADLAVGTPFEDLVGGNKTSISDAGAVTILYGSGAGLVATSTTVPNSQIWHQNVSGVVEDAEANDRFGAALAAGDFNGDRFTDLAVAVPGERNASGTVVGAVHVLYGSATGLTATGNQLFLASSFSTKFRFTDFSLVWANFNGDRDADGDSLGDLAIEALSGQTPQVLVLRGSPGGLTAAGSQLLSFPQCDVGLCGEETYLHDLVLAAGDFSGDGLAELVVGAPYGPGGTVANAGNVRILRSETSGLTQTGAQLLHQNVAGVPEVAEAGDKFGAALAVGDFDGDGQLDLAVGVPEEDNGKRIFFSSTGGTSGVFEPNSIADGGAVNLFLTSLGGRILFEAQFRPEESGTALLLGNREVEPGDRNGAALAAGDFDDDGFSDLAVGGPGETLGSAAGAGSATIFYGSSAGFDELNDWQFWTEAALGGTSAAGDNFGAPLSAWNFGRNHSVVTAGPVRTADLAIGIPAKDLGGRSDVGAVRVIYGFTTGLATSTAAYNPGPTQTPQPGPSQFWHQDVTGVPDQNESGDRFGSALY